MSVSVDPLVAPIPPEVPLENAPLVRVLAQVRFPEILSVERREFVAPFQEAIRTSYPVLRQEQTQEVFIGPGGPGPTRQRTVWRFSESSGQWRVSLAPDFLSLETTRYLSRADFFERFGSLLGALGTHVEPAQIDRLGIRYIDRIEGTAVEELSRLVRPEVRGISGTPASTHAVLAISESAFEVSGVRVYARWGVLPPGATVDPSALEPSAEKSWILDLDVSSEGAMEFDVEALLSEGRRYAERVYAIFRWAVTDAFLARYGGSP
jgi:uncharacterized protein (TIGR04255 family)